MSQVGALGCPYISKRGFVGPAIMDRLPSDVEAQVMFAQLEQWSKGSTGRPADPIREFVALGYCPPSDRYGYSLCMTMTEETDV